MFAINDANFELFKFSLTRKISKFQIRAAKAGLENLFIPNENAVRRVHEVLRAKGETHLIRVWRILKRVLLTNFRETVRSSDFLKRWWIFGGKNHQSSKNIMYVKRTMYRNDSRFNISRLLIKLSFNAEKVIWARGTDKGNMLHVVFLFFHLFILSFSTSFLETGPSANSIIDWDSWKQKNAFVQLHRGEWSEKQMGTHRSSMKVVFHSQGPKVRTRRHPWSGPLENWNGRPSWEFSTTRFVGGFEGNFDKTIISSCPRATLDRRWFEHWSYFEI